MVDQKNAQLLFRSEAFSKSKLAETDLRSRRFVLRSIVQSHR